MAFTIYWPRANEPFVLIPYRMRPGQSPEDILPDLRSDWVPLTAGHPAVARDIMWSAGTFDVVDSDPGPALALNHSLHADQVLADLDVNLAEEIAKAKAVVALASALNQARPGLLPDPAPGQSDLFAAPRVS